MAQEMHEASSSSNGPHPTSEALRHSPPTSLSTSYEAANQKRQRTNSISGRLRSASDLEERGLIDRFQKGVLKDLIISGEEALQSALESYERGDTFKLEALMERGLLNRRSSLDLLEELDMGDLNVATMVSSATTAADDGC